MFSHGIKILSITIYIFIGSVSDALIPFDCININAFQVSVTFHLVQGFVYPFTCGYVLQVETE